MFVASACNCKDEGDMFRWEMEPRGFAMSNGEHHFATKTAKMLPRGLRNAKKPQEAQDGSKRPQEAPEDSRRPQEAIRKMVKNHNRGCRFGV